MDEESQFVKEDSKISSVFCDQPSAVRDEVPDLKTEDVVMPCLIRAISHPNGMVIDKIGAMVE
jgi:hypothetical protein